MFSGDRMRYLVAIALMAVAAPSSAEHRVRLVYDQPATYDQQTWFPVVLSPARESMHITVSQPFRRFHACWRGDTLVYCKTGKAVPGRWHQDEMGRAFVVDRDAHLRALGTL